MKIRDKVRINENHPDIAYHGLTGTILDFSDDGRVFVRLDDLPASPYIAVGNYNVIEVIKDVITVVTLLDQLWSVLKPLVNDVIGWIKSLKKR